MHSSRLLAFLISLGLMTACGQTERDVEPDREALRAAAMAFDAALDQRRLDAIVSFISERTVMLPDGGAEITGLDAIGSVMDRAINRRGFRSEADPPRIGVAASGDVGYSLTNLTRTYERSYGTLSVEHYRDLHVWERQADGSWKIVLDMWNALPDEPTGAE